MLLQLLNFFLIMISFITGQPTLHIGIIDDLTYSHEVIDLKISNIKFCSQSGMNLRLSWMNSSISMMDLVDQLEFNPNRLDIYLTRTESLRTELIHDFCQQSDRLHISMQSSLTTAPNLCLKTMFVRVVCVFN
jgi:hypothetical protein